MEDTYDRQLRRSSWSWKAWGGALGITFILFSMISASSVIVQRPRAPTLPKLQFVFVPPPPIDTVQSPPPPVSSILEDSLAFDPTDQGPRPEIPLDFLQININPQVAEDFALHGDFRPQLDVSRPEIRQPMIVFDQNEVDEKPIWLYGPMPRPKNTSERVFIRVLVLYAVSEKGKTSNVHILDSNDETFNESVTEAIVDWTFRPAQNDGKAVKVWVQQFVDYDTSSKSPFTL